MKLIQKKGFKKVKIRKKQKYDCNYYLNIKISLINLILILFCIIILIITFYIIIKRRNKNILINKISNKQNKTENNNILENSNENEEKIYLDQFETYIYNNIKEQLVKHDCCQMWDNQREFLNGVVRKFRPKKIVEIGVYKGGGTSIILNAIQDIENAHLYSIDLSDDHKIGKCVRNLFPNFLNKWTLFTGDITAKFMEQIGNNIDMVMIDSAHFEPGEILDFIMVLPFLKEEAIVGIHDIANQITKSPKRNEYAPYIIFNIIRGKTYLPSGEKRLIHDIGAKKLEINQMKYIHDYFRALGGQWQYFPKEKHIQLMIEYFKKYYDNDCLIMFNETVEFNRHFVKKNPRGQIYGYNSD